MYIAYYMHIHDNSTEKCNILHVHIYKYMCIYIYIYDNSLTNIISKTLYLLSCDNLYICKI